MGEQGGSEVVYLVVVGIEPPHAGGQSLRQLRDLVSTDVEVVQLPQLLEGLGVDVGDLVVVEDQEPDLSCCPEMVQVKVILCVNAATVYMYGCVCPGELRWNQE